MATATPNITFALTSIFTPPASCLSPTNTLQPLTSDLPTYTQSPAGSDVQNVTDFGISGGDWYAVTKGVTSDCFPSSFYPTGTTTVSSGTTYSVATFYSPGACPSGYATVQTQILSTDAATTCCPSLYSLGATSTGSPLCEMFGWSAWVIVDGSGNSETVTGRGQFATPIIYRFRHDDLALFTTSSSGLSSATTTSDTAASSYSTAGTTSGVTATPIPTATASTSATAASTEKGLSTGAQAGIGVGVAFGVLAVLLVAALLLWRRHRKRLWAKSADAQLPSASEKKVALNGNNWSHEMGNERHIAEMGAPTPVAELDGAWRGWEASGDIRGDYSSVHQVRSG